MDPLVNNHAHIPHLRAAPLASAQDPNLMLAARVAEGPMRDLLRAILDSDAHQDGPQAAVLRNLLPWIEAVIEGRA